MELPPKDVPENYENYPYTRRVFLGIVSLTAASGLGVLNLCFATVDLHQLKTTAEQFVDIGKATETHYHLFTLFMCLNAIGVGIFGGIGGILLLPETSPVQASEDTN